MGGGALLVIAWFWFFDTQLKTAPQNISVCATRVVFLMYHQILTTDIAAYVTISKENSSFDLAVHTPISKTCGLLTILLSLRCETDSSSVKWMSPR